MRSKQYIFNPTAEEYFKTKHPVAGISIFLPLLIYYIYTRSANISTLLLLVGGFGSLLFGIGLTYLFAYVKKIYAKGYVPALAILLGGIMVAISLFFA